ncbi:MAG: methyl-accepting chemotaxis protein [Halarcobacter sp.]
MNLGKRLSILIISISFIALVISFIVLNQYKSEIKNNVYENTKANLITKLDDKIAGRLEVGITNAIAFANDQYIVDALRTNNRSLAIKELNVIADKFSKEANFKKLKIHIHTADIKSFLRAWKPKKFGDDLSGFRHTISKVKETKKSLTTIEIGNIGIFLVAITPVIENGTYLGSLEILQRFNILINQFKKDKENLLVLLDNKFESTAKLMKNKVRIGNYILSQSKYDKDFLTAARKIDFSTLLKEGYILDDKYFYTYKTIQDFEGKNIGISLISEDKKVVDNIIDDTSSIINTALLIIVLLIVVLTTTILISLKKVVLNPLNDFQQGLLEFFKFLNKETKSSPLININTNDEIGVMTKVVNQNIENTKTLMEEDAKLIEDVKRVVSLVGQGKLNQRIEKSTKDENLTELKDIFNNMLDITSKNVCEDINKITAVFESFAKLDFRPRVENDEGAIAKGINNLADIISQILIENKSNGLTLEDSSHMLIKNVNTLNQNSNEAAAALEETAAALEEITGNISNNTNNIIEMSNLASHVTSSASNGEELASITTKAMNEIDVEVNAINDAITVIDQIAFQTNILSLNAAVESATAGEAGKGFAVVAAEVRNLATRSADAAKEIKTLVLKATEKANNGKKISDDMINGYVTLKDDISKTIQLIKNVEMASKEQLAGIEQINNAVNSLDQQTQQNAMVASQTHHIAQETDNLAKLIVNDTNAKEFTGKEEVKAKPSNNPLQETA